MYNSYCMHETLAMFYYVYEYHKLFDLKAVENLFLFFLFKRKTWSLMALRNTIQFPIRIPLLKKYLNFLLIRFVRHAVGTS